MTVIPIRQSHECHRAAGPADHCRSTAIRGTFRSPRGLTGTMHGILRLEHFRVGPEGPVVEGVFAGELVDGDGAHIGVGSRRQSASVHLDGPVRTESPKRPAPSHEPRATIGPATVDLMGFVVSIPAVAVPAPCAMGLCSHANDSTSNDADTEER